MGQSTLGGHMDSSLPIAQTYSNHPPLRETVMKLNNIKSNMTVLFPETMADMARSGEITNGMKILK